MHPLILIGFDLVVSAVLILLAMHVVWSRVRTHLEAQGRQEIDGAGKATPAGFGERKYASAEHAPDEWEFGGITQKAATLKQKGCSMEEIAQRLELPTREVEMVLAISEMTKTDKCSRRLSVALP